MSNGVLRSDDLEIDFHSRRVKIDGVPLELRVMEYDLLAFFALHPHELFSRSDLLKLVWHSDTDWQQESTVTEHVHRLRAKITRRGQRHMIVTVKGGGYRFDPRLDDDVDEVVSEGICRNGSPAPLFAELEFAGGEYVLVTTLRALLRIGSAEEAAALLQFTVRQMGGTVLAAQDAGADALSVDVALGAGAPMFAVAERSSVARIRLERLLPALAEDARQAIQLLRRTTRREEYFTGDALTGRRADPRPVTTLPARALTQPLR